MTKQPQDTGVTGQADVPPELLKCVAGMLTEWEQSEELAGAFARRLILLITELHPDAWQRLERAVDVVAKSPPQHRTAPKPKAKKKKQKSKSGR